MVAADHLQVPRQHGLFNHHGIDLGDGTVAHYLEGRSIIRSTIQEFCNGQTSIVIQHEGCSPPGLTVSRALSRLGEQNYNLLFNNCEHFAIWCKTGAHRSIQIENLLEKTSLGAFSLGQVFPAAFLTAFKILLQKGISDESSRQKAQQALLQLTHVRKELLSKLNSILTQLDGWLNDESRSNEMNYEQKCKSTLLLTGQKLADQLTTIETLEARIIKKLEQPSY